MEQEQTPPANAGKDSPAKPPAETAGGSAENEQQPDPTPPQSPIDTATNLLKQITKQNEMLENNLKKMEQLAANNLVAGTAFAGQPQTTKEQKEIEEAKKLIEGTGFENEIF